MYSLNSVSCSNKRTFGQAAQAKKSRSREVQGEENLCANLFADFSPFNSAQYMPADPKPLKERVIQSIPITAVYPVYGQDDEGYATDEISYLAFTLKTPFLKEYFGTDTLKVTKIGTGDCWQVWRPVDRPETVLKVVNPLTYPQMGAKAIQDSLSALKNYPKESGLLPDEFIAFVNQFMESGILVQPYAEPFTLSERPEFLPRVRDTLLAICLGTLKIEDFRPRNVGLYRGELVHFDPSNVQLGEDLSIDLIAYYKEWSGGNSTILSALVEPLWVHASNHEIVKNLLDKLVVLLSDVMLIS